MAAARSQSRPDGYRLLADALSLTLGANAGEDTNDGAEAANVWAERSVLDVLAAPRAMGEYTARPMAEPIGVVADTMLAELDEPMRARLIAGLRECTDTLPESAGRERSRPKLPEDARGAGRDVLDRWVDASGNGTDPIRQAARVAAMRAEERSYRQRWQYQNESEEERQAAFDVFTDEAVELLDALPLEAAP